MREATIWKLRMVRIEGKREVSRESEHYTLDAILGAGFRVRRDRDTHFGSGRWRASPNTW